MKRTYDDAVLFMKSYGWEKEKLPDGLFVRIATMMELFAKDDDLKPADISNSDKAENQKYADLIIAMSIDFKCGKIEDSHYINTLLNIAQQVRYINTQVQPTDVIERVKVDIYKDVFVELFDFAYNQAAKNNNLDEFNKIQNKIHGN